MKKIASALFIFLAFSAASLKTEAQIAVVVSVRLAPPEMPVYEQPACPVEGYLWTPGYWAYGEGYYWVPGVWVAPPHPGFLWTPCWWGFENGYYGYHEGYWGHEVGYYGGINYGYGYRGDGYYGGRWNGDRFEYNTAVCHVDNNYVHNTYVDNTVIDRPRTSNASFNGPGGYTRQPTDHEMLVARDPGVIRATSEQQTHQRTAGNDKNQYFYANNGRPATTTMDKVNGNPYDEKGTQHARTTAEPARQTTAMPSHASTATHPQQQHTAARPQTQQTRQGMTSHAATPQQHSAAKPQQSNYKGQQGQARGNSHAPQKKTTQKTVQHKQTNTQQEEHKSSSDGQH